MEDNILCVLLYQFHFQMIKENLYLLPENLSQLNNLSVLWNFLNLGRNLFQLIVLLKPDSNFFNSFTLSSVHQVTTGT